MSNRKPAGYWTLERCMEDAKQHSTTREWRNATASGYHSAKRNGWLTQCQGHMLELRKPHGHWTLERCMKDALRFKTRRQWQKQSKGGYLAALKRGWLDECCAHMTYRRRPDGHWTLAHCMEDAAQYEGRREWSLANATAYLIAAHNGWLDQCCAHMDRGYKATDNDVVYIWRNADSDLHKIGVTSARIGEDRIAICKRHNDMDPRIVFMLKVDDARAVESQLLELGTDPELDSSIDGYTEFRELTNDDLREAVSIAYSAALAA